MKALLLSAFVIFAFAASAMATSDELVHIAGILSEQVFPGRPNYESTDCGDEAERVWIVTTNGTAGQKRYQLVFGKKTEQLSATLHRCIGKPVVVTGSMREAVSGHHHTEWLISIRTIEEDLKY